MELTDSLTVAALISGRSQIRSRVAERANSSRPNNSRLNRRPQCKCGSCLTCLDNAKWERVFSEKFEDPNYYKTRVVWGASSLESF